MDKAILRFWLRREQRLKSRNATFRLDADDDEETKGGSHGNTKLPYGLAKGEGIDTTGMSPKDVWNALEGKGYSAGEAYRGLKEGKKGKELKSSSGKKMSPVSKGKTMEQEIADQETEVEKSRKAYNATRKKENRYKKMLDSIGAIAEWKGSSEDYYKKLNPIQDAYDKAVKERQKAAEDYKTARKTLKGMREFALTPDSEGKGEYSYAGSVTKSAKEKVGKYMGDVETKPKDGTFKVGDKEFQIAGPKMSAESSAAERAAWKKLGNEVDATWIGKVAAKDAFKSKIDDLVSKKGSNEDLNRLLNEMADSDDLSNSEYSELYGYATKKFKESFGGDTEKAKKAGVNTSLAGKSKAEREKAFKKQEQSAATSAIKEMFDDGISKAKTAADFEKLSKQLENNKEDIDEGTYIGLRKSIETAKAKVNRPDFSGLDNDDAKVVNSVHQDLETYKKFYNKFKRNPSGYSDAYYINTFKPKISELDKRIADAQFRVKSLSQESGYEEEKAQAGRYLDEVTKMSDSFKKYINWEKHTK